MDRYELEKLDEWDRPDLEAEARRIGLWAPHRKSDAELMKKIRAHHNAPLRRASRFLKRAASFARELTTPALPAAPPPPPVAANADPAPKTPSDPPAARVRVKRVSARARDAEIVDEPLKDEPMPTRTMARLLAAQGHAGRALAIYRRLLRDAPDDPELLAAVSKLKSARSRGAKPRPRTDSDDDESAPAHIVLAPTAGYVVVAWSMSEDGARRGRRLLGNATRAVRGRSAPRVVARKTVRVVVVRPSSGGGIVRETHDFDGDGMPAAAIPVPEGSRVTAAVGVSAAGQFVSVAHAPPART